MIPHPKTLDDVLQGVRSRVSPARPSKDFEPLKAAAADLLRYGLPTEPELAHGTERHAFWSRLLSGPLTFAEPDLDFDVRQDLHRVAPRRQTGRAGRRRESSLNWSGVYIKPNSGKAFTEIHGEWIVPKPSPPADPATNTVAPGSYRVVSFIGLDGQRRYANSSLPQIGTASRVDVDAAGNPTEQTYAWLQWWVRDQHHPEIRIRSVAIRPGDTVMCSLMVMSPTIVRFALKNQTTGYFFGPIEVPSPPVAGPGSAQVQVTGATAEWVTERPTSFDEKHTLYELPNYGSIRFTNCYAVSTSHGAPEQVQRLDLATLIKMRAIKQNPHRSEPISETRLDGDQSFTTSYLGRFPVTKSGSCESASA